MYAVDEFTLIQYTLSVTTPDRQALDQVSEGFDIKEGIANVTFIQNERIFGQDFYIRT